MSETPELVVLAEEAGTPECGQVQADVPANVCTRAAGHDGPHVGSTDGVYLQWES